MPSKRVGGTSTSTSTSFTPLSDLVPASIPCTDQARAVLETLRACRDPGIDALLGALNCGGACEAAGAPYSAKCGCRAAFAAAAGGGGAGGGAAPRCVRGLAPPPGSHRKVGLWAKPPKAEEEQEEAEAGKEKEAKEGEEEDEEEVRRTRERGQFFFFLSRKKNSLTKNLKKMLFHTENRPRRPLQPRGHLLRRRRPPVPLRRPCVQARALQRDERGGGKR